MPTKNAGSKARDRDPLDREFDFSKGVQGFFTKRGKGLARTLVLEGELAQRFTDDDEVRELLTAQLKAEKAGKKPQRKRPSAA